MKTHPITQKKRQTSSDAPATDCLRRTASIPDFDALPESAMVRLGQLVRDPKHPTKPVPLPFSAATLWRKVSAGTFVKPLKLGARTTVWRVSEVRAWMAAQDGKAVA